MTHSFNLYEPDIAHALERNCSWFNPYKGGEESVRQAWTVFHAFEPLAPMSPDNSYREVWFKINRGEPNDWVLLQDYQDDTWDDEEVPSEKDWMEDWQSLFPEKEYWHLLGCREDDGWLSIAIDNCLIIQVSPEVKESYEDEKLARVLSWLSEEVTEIVEEIKLGRYATRVEESLPAEQRYGIIKRSDLWRTADAWYRFGISDINEAELQLLAVKLSKQPDIDSLGRVDKLSSGYYFSLLKEAYTAAGYKNTKASWIGDIPADDGRAWYAHFGDARDYSLLTLNPDSFGDFMQWYLESKGHFDHNFEIFLGRGCSRVHLNPVLDDAGWYLSLWGSITWHGVDMARIWKYLNDNDMPTYVGDAERLARALRGDDYVLVMPSHTSTDYVRGEFFGQDIVTAIHLPEENRAEIMEHIEWQPLETASLSTHE